MNRLQRIAHEATKEIDQREAEMLLGWRVLLASAALPRAMQEVSGMNPSHSPAAAAKLALRHADEVLKLIIEEAQGD